MFGFFKSSHSKIQEESIKYLINTIGISNSSAKKIARSIDTQSTGFMLDLTKDSDVLFLALRPLFATVIASYSFNDQENELINGLKIDLEYIQDVQFPEALANQQISTELFNKMISFGVSTRAYLAQRNLIK